MTSNTEKGYYNIFHFVFQEKLVSLVFGMIRKDKFNFVDMFREEAFTAIRAAVKQVIVYTCFVIL